MKPCSQNRQLIAWLAVDALDASQADTLRSHLRTCQPCRDYFDQISRATGALNAAATISNPGIRVSESFHPKLMRRLEAEKPATFSRTLSAYFRFAWPEWQGARRSFATATAFAITIIVAVFIFGRRPAPSPIAPAGSQIASVPAPKRDPDPTFSNYQIVANRSLENLDELLARQGNRNPAPGPIYTASSFRPPTSDF